MGRKAKPAVEQSCANCGATFSTPRHNARFCPATKCSRQFRRRMEDRGRALAPFVMAWIEGRGGGHAGTHPVAGPAMKEITAIAREFIDQDREEGRPSTIAYVESLLAESLYIDRKRR